MNRDLCSFILQLLLRARSILFKCSPTHVIQLSLCSVRRLSFRAWRRKLKQCCTACSHANNLDDHELGSTPAVDQLTSDIANWTTMLIMTCDPQQFPNTATYLHFTSRTNTTLHSLTTTFAISPPFSVTLLAQAIRYLGFNFEGVQVSL